VGFFWLIFWAGLALLAVMGFVRVRERLRRKSGYRPEPDDEPWRASLTRLQEPEEPLDWDAIEEEERRFWDEERWDDAGEW